VVDIGAGIAALGVLLNLIPGVSRTTLAMARERELPHWLAHVDVARSIPLRAEVTVAVIVIVLVIVVDLRDAIAISGVAVLTYYAITNAAALTLSAEQRRWPAFIAVGGLIGCVTLVAALPPPAVVTGVVTLAAGVLVRLVRDGAAPLSPTGWGSVWWRARRCGVFGTGRVGGYVDVRTARHRSAIA
jgi:basic amino acid/polyamine antiporter, APA family